MSVQTKTLKLLIVEDNLAIAKQLAEFFEGLGWCIDHTARGAAAVVLVQNNVYDVILLDLNLPDMDGIEVCRVIKAQAPVNIPVLMLTARDAFADKAQGFETGADDYVTKPFEFRELALRCQALARRAHLHKSNKIRIADLMIDKSLRTAQRESRPLQLTHIAYEILVVLAEAWPGAVTRSALIHQIWGDEPPESDALRSHIYALRNQLDKPYRYPMLATVINVGFQLKVPDEI